MWNVITGIIFIVRTPHSGNIATLRTDATKASVDSPIGFVNDIIY